MEKIEMFSNELERALITLNQDLAEKVILNAIKTRSVAEIAGKLISNTLKRIGDNWEKGGLSLSQVYMSGIICEKIIDKILPSQQAIRKNQPKIAIAVFEDFHMLGKRIVYSTLKASGIDLIDLGGGLTTEKLVEHVKNENIKILLLSVLMLPSALRIKDIKNQLNGIDIKIIVGGAPFRFDEELWNEVGADYFGKDSSDALEIVEKLINN